jgi:hypothetical protein
LRLEPDRLLLPLLLRPFDDERDFDPELDFEPDPDFAVVRLPLPLDEPLPFDERLRLDAERPRELDADDFEREDELPRLREPELRLRELDDERRCFFTSPSSIVPRQEPLSSSSMVT